MVKFITKHHADIDMFDSIAEKLLKLMGHSGTVPGALAADEVAGALENLEKAINTPQAAAGDNWDSGSVSLKHRALPLIGLLQAALTSEEHIIWEKR